MAIKISFDASGIPEQPTIVLAYKSGEKIGALNATKFKITDNLNEASDIYFEVVKEETEANERLWDKLTDFKLVWCKEWNAWFEITVSLQETNSTVKLVTGRSLGYAELSQIKLFGIEINNFDAEYTDLDDIKVIYDPKNPSRSILNTIVDEKAPHYKIVHVDKSIQNLQRSFNFDDISICEALQTVCKEIEAICVFNYKVKDENIHRELSFYDLKNHCICGERDADMIVCPNEDDGNTHQVYSGFGENTGVFVTSDELAEEIDYHIDADKVKNCFKLEAGDDYMTATIKNYNPNGSDSIWHFSDKIKEDMSDELKEKLSSYDKLYDSYINKKSENPANISFIQNEYLENAVINYNSLVDKYNAIYKELNPSSTVDKEDFQKLPTSENNYKFDYYGSLMKAYYDILDFYQFLYSSMMPNINISDKSLEDQVKKINSINGNTIGLTSLKSSTSEATIQSAIVNYIKIYTDSAYYKFEVVSPTFFRTENVIRSCSCSIKVTSYAKDEKGTYPEKTIENITFMFEENTAEYTKQKIDAVLHKADDDNVSVTGLFKLEDNAFKEELKKYSLKRLESFYDTCQTCLDIIISRGNTNTGGDGYKDNQTDVNFDTLEKDDNYDVFNPDSNFAAGTTLNKLYKTYLSKSKIIEAELDLRREEVAYIIGEYEDANGSEGFIDYSTGNFDSGEIKRFGALMYVVQLTTTIQNKLNFEHFLCPNKDDYSLMVELLAYKREQKYSNSNYVSDGLTNAQMFDMARQFFEKANEELLESSEMQHIISTKLKNLLLIPKFNKVTQNFSVGNWIRVKVDNKVYRLRLVSYAIDFDNLENITVEFSDVKLNGKDSETDIKSILDSASAIASSYDYTQRQAEKGSNIQNIYKNWVSKGLDTTNVKIMNGADGQDQSWDSHGMLFREKNLLTDEYEDTQLKIINSTIAITDDNWKSTKTAVGKFMYKDINTGEYKVAYGINAETLIGKLILGEELGIYNDNNSLSFDKNGLLIKNSNNIAVSINPENADIFKIYSVNGKTKDTIMSVDAEGNSYFKGSIEALSGKIGNLKVGEDGSLTISKSYEDTHDPDIKYFQKVSLGGDSFFNVVFNKVVYDENGMEISNEGYENSFSVNNEGLYFSGARLGYLKLNFRKKYESSTSKTSPLTSDSYNNYYDQLSCEFPIVVGKAKSDNREVEDLSYFAMFPNLDNNSSSKIGTPTLNDYLMYYTTHGLNSNITLNSGTASAKDRFYIKYSGEIGGLSFTNLSDRKDKKDISAFEPDKLKEFFMNLSPVTFRYKVNDSNRIHMGFIAQDVAEVSKNTLGNLSVYKADTYLSNGHIGTYSEDIPDEELHWSLSYTEFISPLWAMVQYQQKEIEKLSNQVRELSERKE